MGGLILTHELFMMSVIPHSTNILIVQTVSTDCIFQIQVKNFLDYTIYIYMDIRRIGT